MRLSGTDPQLFARGNTAHRVPGSRTRLTQINSACRHRLRIGGRGTIGVDAMRHRSLPTRAAVRASSLLLVAVAALTAAALPAAAQPEPHRLQITGPASADFIAVAINSPRRMAGRLPPRNVGVRQKDVTQDFGRGDPYTMSASGRVFGVSLDESDNWRAAVWGPRGEVVLLERKIGWRSSGAFGGNDQGDTVGFFTDTSREDHAVHWTRAGLTDLGLGWATKVNNLGLIVGTHTEAFAPERAAAWQGGTMTLLGQFYSHAYAVNDEGRIVGDEADEAGTTLARLWYQGQTVNLGAAFAATSYAHDINQAGTVVGTYRYPGSYDNHAAVWYRDAMGNYAGLDLETLLRPGPVEAGWTLISATGIDALGDIIGIARNSILCARGTCDDYGFVLTRSAQPDDFPIPSP
jgi:hypothetical protein